MLLCRHIKEDIARAWKGEEFQGERAKISNDVKCKTNDLIQKIYSDD